MGSQWENRVRALQAAHVRFRALTPSTAPSELCWAGSTAQSRSLWQQDYTPFTGGVIHCHPGITEVLQTLRRWRHHVQASTEWKHLQSFSGTTYFLPKYKALGLVDSEARIYQSSVPHKAGIVPPRKTDIRMCSCGAVPRGAQDHLFGWS